MKIKFTTSLNGPKEDVALLNQQTCFYFKQDAFVPRVGEQVIIPFTKKDGSSSSYFLEVNSVYYNYHEEFGEVIVDLYIPRKDGLMGYLGIDAWDEWFRKWRYERDD